jgi:hypothetical protein
MVALSRGTEPLSSIAMRYWWYGIGVSSIESVQYMMPSTVGCNLQ